jgi:hypothetical protein
MIPMMTFRARTRLSFETFNDWESIVMLTAMLTYSVLPIYLWNHLSCLLSS